jgi:hypothetical protein
VQARRLQGQSETEVIQAVTEMLPAGASRAARRRRAQRAVRQIEPPSRSTTGPRIGYAVALGIWAAQRAQRQLEAAVRRGVLTEEEAAQRSPGRISRFMSRATSTGGA